MPDRTELGYEASITLKGVVVSLIGAWRADPPNLDRWKTAILAPARPHRD
jgi:hypothetical protein